MSQSPSAAQHVKPYVYEDLISKSLHFSIHEIQSRMQVLKPHSLDLRYTRTMMGFLMFNPHPESMAMLGLGGGSLAKFCHRYLPTSRMDVVEINPHVIALRDEFCIPPDGTNFKVIAADGAQFIRDVTSCYDVLLLDAFDDQGLPSGLSTPRFYQNCARALQPGGIMIANFPAALPELKRCINRIRRSFQDAVMVVGYEGLDNVVVFAFKLDDGQKLGSRIGVIGCPKGLDSEAWEQLMPAFSSIAKVWNENLSS
jgi:spermidine synthase